MHRADLGFELEVMAKKMDRFGWERDRGTKAHDRLMTDWMDGLEDYPLDEVQDACRQWVQDSPRKMPNEGDIRAEIQKARHHQWLARKETMPPEPEREAERVSKDAAARILEEAGFTAKRFGGDA